MDLEDIETIYKCNEKYKFSHPNGFDGSIEINTANINLDNIYDALGIDNAKLPDKYNIQVTKLKQRRTHRKKRINKKWLKKYGYKFVYDTMKGFELKTYADGAFEFRKDMEINSES